MSQVSLGTVQSHVVPGSTESVGVLFGLGTFVNELERVRRGIDRVRGSHYYPYWGPK